MLSCRKWDLLTFIMSRFDRRALYIFCCVMRCCLKVLEWLVVSSIKLRSSFLGICLKVSVATWEKKVGEFIAPWGMTMNLYRPEGVVKAVLSLSSG